MNTPVNDTDLITAGTALEWLNIPKSSASRYYRTWSACLAALGLQPASSYPQPSGVGSACYYNKLDVVQKVPAAIEFRKDLSRRGKAAHNAALELARAALARKRKSNVHANQGDLALRVKALEADVAWLRERLNTIYAEAQ